MKNKLHKWGTVLVMAMLLSLVLACTPPAKESTSYLIEATDQLGRVVKMDRIPQRIISLAPSNTEILFALGLGDRVVGVTQYCNYPEEAKEKEEIGGFATADPEKIIALKPDLILAKGSLQKSLVTKLEGKGQTVFWLYPQSVTDILESIETIGKLTGSSAAAQELRKEIEARIKGVEAKIKDIPEQERPTVFRVMNLGPPGTIGGESFQTDIYRLAGGRNIFADTDKDYFQLDLKTLIKLDPDIIVVCGEDEEEAKKKIKDQEGWGDLTAVKTDRITVISCDLICRPSPRIAQTIEQLAVKFEEIMSSPVEFTDQLGRVVKLEGIPERIVSLAPSNTEIMFALGLQDSLVAVTDYCDYPPEAKDKPSVGGFSTPNIEEIIALSPDLILATSIHEKRIIPQLEEKGMTVFALTAKTLDKTLAAITLVGTITRKGEESSKLVAEMKQRIKVITDKTDSLRREQGPGVFYLTWHDPLMTSGSGTMLNELIQKAGGRNIFSDVSGTKSVDLEALITRDPQVMIAGIGMGSGEDQPFQYLTAESRLNNTEAVKNGRIYGINMDLSGRAGPRIVDGLEQFARCIHPEIFGEPNNTKGVKVYDPE